MDGPPKPHYRPPAVDKPLPPYIPPPPLDYPPRLHYHHQHHHPPHHQYNHPPLQTPNPQFPTPNSHFPPHDPQFHPNNRWFPPPDPQYYTANLRFPPPDPQFQPPVPQVQIPSHLPEPILPPIEPSHTVASSSSAEPHHQDKKRKLSDESERQPPPPSREEVLQNIMAAVEQSWRELVASLESVSTWKVSQSALSKLKADSWESLSFRLFEVPSLHRILVTEEKINTFIECFVAVRSVTSLYDLEMAICEFEGIERFEELELGPLLRHPLIELYFSSKNMTEVYKITSKEIMEYLKEYIVKLEGKHFNGDELFDFVARKCRLSSPEKMGLRIQNLGKHIKFLRGGLFRDKCLVKTHSPREDSLGEKRKERHLLPVEEKQVDEQREDSLGENSKKKLLFSKEENQMDELVNAVMQPDPLTCILKNSENNELAKKNEKLKQQICASKDKTSTTGFYDAAGLDSIRLFITFWKENCCKLTPNEVLEGMMQFYGLSTSQIKSCRNLVSVQPFSGLLNVAILSIKNGSWNSIYNICQSLDKLGCQNTQSNNGVEFEGLEVGSSGKNLMGSTAPLSKSGFSVTVGDIMNRVADYFAKRLIHCEALLKKQYGVKEFGDLGYGDYLTFIERHISMLPEELHENLDGQVQKEFSVQTKTMTSHKLVTVEDIMAKVKEYFASKLPHCEAWLNKQYGVKEFGDFGYGDYLTFLQRHIHVLPELLHESVNGQVHKQLTCKTGAMLIPTSVTVEDIINRVTDYFAKRLVHCEALLKKQYGVNEFGDLGYGDYLTFLERNISILPEVLCDNQNGQVHQQLSFETEPVFSPTSVTIGDIMKKVKDFLARKLPHSESSLNKQYGVKDFGELGHGEYLTFLERHLSFHPEKLHNNLNDVVHSPFAFEVNLLEQQLIVLLSQASDSLWEDGIITKQRIVDLLARQFPFANFNVVEKGCLDNISHAIKEHKSSIASKCLLFSATLTKMYNSGDDADHIANHSLDGYGFEAETCSKLENVGASTSKDAVEVVLKSPMLVDLNSWLHWDIVYAPSLGPLLMWLLTDVNAKDLLCLLTRDSKIIRINPSASVESFYGALLQGSPFQVAVEVLSLVSLFGGRRNLPLSLLKCRARQAFEVLFTMPNDGGHMYENCLTNKKTSMKLMINENPGFVSGASIALKENDVKEPTYHASRLFLDCLGYLPSEFYSLAADILLSGLQSVVNHAPSSVLLQCRSRPEHLMLHEIGFALGITEWINDHQKVCPIIVDQSSMPMPDFPHKSLCSNTEFEYQQQGKAKMLPKEILEAEYESGTNLNSSAGGLEIDISVRDSIQDAPHAGGMKNAALVIETIRREEFGLDSDVESPMLKKQHARLGRALHCLSQELYSQDSHFLLELIQNADDNAYSKEVEPTLMFILQNSRIIVLNNEQGFTAENIRALCDVGNSTKSGSSSGYIGQKGIGFKSVFRVTDAPEIHSNGFHIKFDITEGQIGFVLPTVVPPCNSGLVGQLASAYPDQMDYNCWNTCIVLPLRSNLTHRLEVGKIISMFSDINPSLLLFIHRLQCIKLISMLDNSFIAMRKEIVADGLVKVTYGENAMTWFIGSKKLFPEIIRPGVQVTEISIAIALKQCENGNYESHLEQQPVFAFLPLRTYGFKFILQGDFVLPSSREEVDGDSIWNQWLLSEFPNLFVSAEKQFCALSCFRENPGKAVTAYMDFVPLNGEVQGFFSCLPRMIISRLRQSDCLLQEGYNNTWVPPCRVLRNWNEQALVLLPDVVLQQHLGLSFLDKDIILSDQLARALGIQDYGPKVLVQCISSICSTENGLKSLGFRWLASWLNELYNMLHSQGMTSRHVNLELDLINILIKVPCVPLSDGTYGSVNEGTIWLNTNFLSTELECYTDSLSFPKLYASMRIVDTKLFSAATEDASCVHDSIVNNVISMLHKIGVQRLTPHDIIKSHILPVISDEKFASRDKSLFIECNAFAMLHFQSSCADCRVEKMNIISEFQSKALLLTNLGFTRLSETTIHFGKEFGSPIDADKLICGLDYSWHEIDVLYLKYPLSEAVSSGLSKWRAFFCSLGVTDFVKVTQVPRNISDLSPTRFQEVKLDRDLISSSMPMRDWESPELDCMLSFLARSGGQESERSKYLLEVLDTLWDHCFSDKTACCFSSKSGENVTSFKSSFMNNLCDVRWVTSTMDDGLHRPRELFYHCEAVQSILGTSVPYAMPKIRNIKLLSEIGFKSRVTIDDILASLQKWRTLEPFKASVSQMSRLYTFISNEPAESKKNALEFLVSEPFIFIPRACEVKRKGDVVGSFFSPKEVYWRDYSGALDSMKELSSLIPNFSMSKMLCHIYPGLRHFFLDDCGVNETPPFLYYLHILEQLSVNPSSLHAATSVFQIFLRWSDGLQCGSMVDGDIFILRDKLLQLDFPVLPTVRDMWVSLHPSFGAVCWSDDDSLKNQFKHSDSIQFLYFGELTDAEKEVLQTKVSVLLQKLGIPALSEIITREAIYHVPSDSSYKASMVDWALPFAQRYIYTVHFEKYTQLKLLELEKLRCLKIVVVEKLLFRNVVKKCGALSQQQFECSCLLQDTVLYTTQESDSHALFMELSRLFFDGALELQLANFLHMLTTMVVSGSTQEQLEFFILNSQKIQRIPDVEQVWCLYAHQVSEENDLALHVDSTSIPSNKHNLVKLRDKEGFVYWPPVGWKTALGFNVELLPTSDMMTEQGESSEDLMTEEDVLLETSPFPGDLGIPGIFGVPEFQPDPVSEQAHDKAALLFPTSVTFDILSPGSRTASKTKNDPGTYDDSQEVKLVGRLGEFTAFQHYKKKFPEYLVNWVNEQNESGLPYDIVIGNGNDREYVEVKSTRYVSKNWFSISLREWQFAAERGNCYSLARVVLRNKDSARIMVYRNPVRLCQLRQLDLGIIVPRKHQSKPSVLPQ